MKMMKWRAFKLWGPEIQAVESDNNEFESTDPPEVQAAASQTYEFETTEPPEIQAAESQQNEFESTEPPEIQAKRLKQTKIKLKGSERPEIQAAAANSTNLTKMYCQKYKQKVATRPKNEILSNFCCCEWPEIQAEASQQQKSQSGTPVFLEKKRIFDRQKVNPHGRRR